MEFMDEVLGNLWGRDTNEVSPLQTWRQAWLLRHEI